MPRSEWIDMVIKVNKCGIGTQVLSESSWFQPSLLGDTGNPYIIYDNDTSTTSVKSLHWTKTQATSWRDYTGLERWGNQWIDVTTADTGFDMSGLIEVIRADRPRAAVTPSPAMERARALLKSLLAPADWVRYEQTGTLLVKGGATGRVYELHNRSNVKNIKCLATGMLLCCHPTARLLPIEDVLVTQKLHLEHNELAFRALANISRPLSLEAVEAEMAADAAAVAA